MTAREMFSSRRTISQLSKVTIGGSALLQINFLAQVFISSKVQILMEISRVCFLTNFYCINGTNLLEVRKVAKLYFSN